MIRLNIVPLLVEHADEICEDLVDMFKKKSIDSAAFMFALVPEGNPAMDKATLLIKRFKVFQEKLAGSGLPVGILLQATMGHGWLPNVVTPYQKIVKLDGTSQYTFCPDGSEFRSYVADAVTKCAKAEPDFLMLDDDTRFLTGRDACFCPLHVKRFNDKYGTAYTSEELRKLAKEDKAFDVQYDEMLCESMCEYAKVIRDAIDAVNPDLHCSFCQCLYDYQYSPKIARILAGRSGKPVLRINNGLYMRDSIRSIVEWVYYTALQINYAPKDFTVLAEPDTCPQNRYSTSATIMRTHLAISTLEGCKGGKLWITRTGVYEPGSGLEYRRALAEDGGMLEAVSSMGITWVAPAVPFTKHPRPMFPVGIPDFTSWNYSFARMGIPFSFSDGPATDRPNLLTREQIRTMTDEELRQVLSGPALLDGSAAILISERGFGELCGFKASAWGERKRVVLERWNGTHIPMDGDSDYAYLEKAEGAVELSTYIHKVCRFADEEEIVAPGSLYFENNLGGRVITVALFYGFQDSFRCYSVFNETRKRQYLDYVQRLSKLEMYHEGDAEVMLRCGFDANGNRVAYICNMGLDLLETIKLRGIWVNDAKPQIMAGSGIWFDAPYTIADGLLTIQYSTLPGRVTILKIR